MIISVTERGTYKRCRRKWFLESRNRRSLTPLVSAQPLVLGTLVHSALGTWLEDSASTPSISFLKAAQAERNRIADVFRAQNGYGIDDNKLNEMDESIILGTSMMSNYEARWKAPLPEGYKIVAQEQRVHVAIPNTEHTEEWVWNDEKESVERVTFDKPTPHYLQGRLDGIVLDEKSRLYVLEHKTYGKRPEERLLRSTDQFVAYQWLLSQLEMPYQVAGVAYDGMWKRAAPPKTVESRPGVLADLFCRMRIEHSPDVIDEFVRELTAEALEMGNNPAIYKNRTSDGSCFWGCGSEPLCSAMSHNEDTAHLLKTEYTKKVSDEDDSIKESD